MKDRILLNEYEAADLIGFTVHWLRKRRYEGLKPDFVRIGSRAIRYDPADLVAFRDENRIETREGAAA